MLFAQILGVHVTVQAVVPSLIVRPALLVKIVRTIPVQQQTLAGALVCMVVRQRRRLMVQMICSVVMTTTAINVVLAAVKCCRGQVLVHTVLLGSQPLEKYVGVWVQQEIIVILFVSLGVVALHRTGMMMMMIV